MVHSFDKSLEIKPEYETENLRIFSYDLKAGFKGAYKSYESLRICTILKGQKNVRVNDGTPFTYNKSEFILLPPNSHVDMVIEEDTKALVYEISDSLVEQVQEHLQSGLASDIVLQDHKGITAHLIDCIQASIKRINDLYVEAQSDSDFLIDLYAQEMIYNLIKHNFLPRNLNANIQDPIKYSIKYIRTHIYSNISLAELADQMHLSSSYLANKFKKQTGFTFKAYVNLLKIKKAHEDLKSHNVSEVCYSLGYGNISYFISLFKKQYGETPKQYAMRIQSK